MTAFTVEQIIVTEKHEARKLLVHDWPEFVEISDQMLTCSIQGTVEVCMATQEVTFRYDNGHATYKLIKQTDWNSGAGIYERMAWVLDYHPGLDY